MPTKNYQPTKDYLTPARLNKTCHDMLKAAREDRAAAKEAYMFFKGIVDQDGSIEPDFDARKSMIECLKLMQSAQQTAIRALDTFVKAEDKLKKKQSEKKEEEAAPTWKDLNNLDLS